MVSDVTHAHYWGESHFSKSVWHSTNFSRLWTVAIALKMSQNPMHIVSMNKFKYFFPYPHPEDQGSDSVSISISQMHLLATASEQMPGISFICLETGEARSPDHHSSAPPKPKTLAFPFLRPKCKTPSWQTGEAYFGGFRLALCNFFWLWERLGKVEDAQETQCIFTNFLRKDEGWK